MVPFYQMFYYIYQTYVLYEICLLLHLIFLSFVYFGSFRKMYEPLPSSSQKTLFFTFSLHQLYSDDMQLCSFSFSLFSLVLFYWFFTVTKRNYSKILHAWINSSHVPSAFLHKDYSLAWHDLDMYPNCPPPQGLLTGFVTKLTIIKQLESELISMNNNWDLQRSSNVSRQPEVILWPKTWLVWQTMSTTCNSLLSCNIIPFL